MSGGSAAERLAASTVNIALGNAVVGLIVELGGVELSANTAASIAIVVAGVASWAWSRWGEKVPMPGRRSDP